LQQFLYKKLLSNIVLIHFMRVEHLLAQKYSSNLSSNNFQGQIPFELGHVVNLDTL
jgi:hypothetical protein